MARRPPAIELRHLNTFVVVGPSMAASAKLGRPSGYRNQRSVDVLLTLRINSAPRCFTGTPGGSR